MTLSLTPFFAAYENFLKGANNAADALALPVNGTALEGEFNVTNSVAFLASFGKYLQFHFKTVEDLANKLHVPGFDALSYAANISKPSRVGTCCSCPRGTDGTTCDDCTEHHNRPKTVGKKTFPPYLTGAVVKETYMNLNNAVPTSIRRNAFQLLRLMALTAFNVLSF